MKRLTPLVMLLLLVGCTMSTSMTTCTDDPQVGATKGVELEFTNTDWRNRDLIVTVELLDHFASGRISIPIGELKLRPGEKWMFCLVERNPGEQYRITWKTLSGDLITKQEFTVGPPTRKVYSEPFDLRLEFD